MTTNRHTRKISTALMAISIFLLCSNCSSTRASEIQHGVIKGSLVASNNASMSDNVVYLAPSHRLLSYGRSVTTNKTGEFVFGDVPEGEYVLAYGPLLLSGERITIGPGEVKHLKLIASETAVQSINGSVAGSNGPITSGTISFLQLNPVRSRWVWPPKLMSASITEKGHYTIQAIEPGRYLVRVQPPAPEPSIRSPYADAPSEKHQTRQAENHAPVDILVIVDIEPGQEVLNILAPEYALYGTVIDSAGNPVSNAQIFFSPSEITSGWLPVQMSLASMTDDNGHFYLRNLSAGLYDAVIMASNAGYQLKSKIQIDASDTAVKWRLEKPLTIDAAIKHPDNNDIMPYLMVMLQDNTKLRSLMDHVLVRGYGDKNLMPPISFPGGKYVVFTMAKVYGYSCEASIIDFNDGTEFNSEVVEAGAIKVILKGTQKDISGRTVRLQDCNGNDIPRLYDPLWSYDYDLAPAVILPTCRDGITTIGWLRPGEYEVTVEGTKAKARVTVTANETITACVNLNDH